MAESHVVGAAPDASRPAGEGRSGAIVAARGVTFAHPGAPPLFDGLHLEIEAGESVAILGPNGSGKTTLVRLLAGLIAPDRGDITLAGRAMAAWAPRARARLVAVVLQETQVLFDFSVLEVVLMGRAPHRGAWGLERQEDFAAARAALRDVDLAGFESRRLHELSSGERQRVFVARALAQAPRLLLLDEPTAWLDLKHRLQIHDILKRLNRERGLTIVVTSHDLNLAARYAARLVILHRGRIAADGPPADVLTAALVRSVYETEARIERDPGTGATYVLPQAPVSGNPSRG